jgi:ribosomal protein S18 acetylase RimI-like enzyme
LEALSANPEAFGSTFETENAQPLSWFFDRLATTTVFGAFSDMKLVAMAGFAIQQGQKCAHKGVLWGMYVRPGARGTGVGRRLIDAVLDHARQHVELIQLTVVRDNEQARRLYASLGFLDYGLEKNALKQEGRYYDEVLMAKDLLGQ